MLFRSLPSHNTKSYSLVACGTNDSEGDQTPYKTRERETRPELQRMGLLRDEARKLSEGMGRGKPFLSRTVVGSRANMRKLESFSSRIVS